MDITTSITNKENIGEIIKNDELEFARAIRQIKNPQVLDYIYGLLEDCVRAEEISSLKRMNSQAKEARIEKILKKFRDTENSEPRELIGKNIRIGSRRTSIRLESEMWDALQQISNIENLTIHQVCTLVDRHSNFSSFTTAVRVFVVQYYRHVNSI